MADEQKPGERQKMITADNEGVWKMDVDTFVPQPDGYLTVGGVEYPIYNFLDIPITDSLKVTRLGEDIKDGASYDARMQRNIEQIMTLNAPRNEKTGEPLYPGPYLTPEHFKGMSPRQVITLTVMASSTAKIPLKAAGTEGSPSGSPSPSPESADSMGGGEKSSSA